MIDRPKDFLSLTDWEAARITRVLELAKRLKTLHRQGRDPRPFCGKHQVLLFQKPSLRTRLSFEIGFAQLGGLTSYTAPSEVGLGERESVADVARVLSRYANVIVARVFAHSLLEELAAHASVPVVNGLSDYNHPCQILSDLMTLSERRGSLEGAHIAWIGDGNNVATSWINAARRLPIRVTLACPEGYEIPAEVRKHAAEAGDRVRFLRDPKAAVIDADVVYTDTWYSMGQEKEKETRRREFAGYTVDEDLMARARPDALFMHCLPAHRGDEVTEAVLEGPRSVIFDQAENRLHAQKAILLSVMGVENAAP